jgi:hypothetical protein
MADSAGGGHGWISTESTADGSEERFHVMPCRQVERRGDAEEIGLALGQHRHSSKQERQHMAKRIGAERESDHAKRHSADAERDVRCEPPTLPMSSMVSLKPIPPRTASASALSPARFHTFPGEPDAPAEALLAFGVSACQRTRRPVTP